MESLEDLGGLRAAVIGAAIEVHRALGPGFAEAVYERALCLELQERSIPFVQQALVLVHYKDEPVGEARLDLVVDERLLLELKAVEAYSPVHLAQLLSYLKVTGLTVGLLINFNVRVLRDGIRRVVSTHPPTSAPSSPSPRLRVKKQTDGAPD